MPNSRKDHTYTDADRNHSQGKVKTGGMEEENRQRTLTPKGREYQKEVLDKEIERLQGKLNGQLKLFDNLLKTKENDTIEQELENTEKIHVS